MIAVYGIIAAIVVLAYWAGVLWIGARADRNYLERENAELRRDHEKSNG